MPKVTPYTPKSLPTLANFSNLSTPTIAII